VKRTLMFFSLCLTVVTSSLAIAQTAQTYPNRAVKIIVGYGAGGVTDVLNRLMADELARRSGQPVVVENKPGAGALLAAQAVKNAPPDGYTLYGGSVTTFTSIYLKESLDASKELLPISTFAVGDWFMYVPTSIGVTNLKELAAYAKANAGKFRFSSPSPGNALLMAVVAKRLDFKFESIPYKTTADTIQALLNGDGQVTFNAASGFPPHIQSGKLRAIATLSRTRSTIMPDVPTAMEQGIALRTNFDIGLWAPLGTPRDVVMKLNGWVTEGLKNPATADRIRNAAMSPTPAQPAEMIENYNNEMAFYKEAAALTGLQPQ